MRYKSCYNRIHLSTSSRFLRHKNILNTLAVNIFITAVTLFNTFTLQSEIFTLLAARRPQLITAIALRMAFDAHFGKTRQKICFGGEVVSRTVDLIIVGINEKIGSFMITRIFIPRFIHFCYVLAVALQFIYSYTCIVFPPFWSVHLSCLVNRMNQYYPSAFVAATRAQRRTVAGTSPAYFTDIRTGIAFPISLICECGQRALIHTLSAIVETNTLLAV